VEQHLLGVLATKWITTDLLSTFFQGVDVCLLSVCKVHLATTRARTRGSFMKPTLIG
jgi:hypothetical protein